MKTTQNIVREGVGGREVGRGGERGRGGTQVVDETIGNQCNTNNANSSQTTRFGCAQ